MTSPRNETKINESNDVLKSAKELFFTREEIIKAFQTGIFQYIDGFQEEEKTDKETDEETNEEIDNTDMSELESEESGTQRKNRLGKGLKSLTPNQILSRLSITLAHLKAGNNSEKLKNKISQLLYSFYRSKKLTKQI